MTNKTVFIDATKLPVLLRPCKDRFDCYDSACTILMIKDLPRRDALRTEREGMDDSTSTPRRLEVLACRTIRSFRTIAQQLHLLSLLLEMLLKLTFRIVIRRTCVGTKLHQA